MADLDKINRDFDALKPGDVDAHIDLARRIKEADKWSSEVGETLIMSAGTTPAKRDRFLAALQSLFAE